METILKSRYGRPKIAVRWQTGATNFFLSTSTSPQTLRSSQGSYEKILGTFSRGVARPGRKCDHSVLSSSEVKKECQYFHSFRKFLWQAKGKIYFVINQLDAQFLFMYVYFYSREPNSVAKYSAKVWSELIWLRKESGGGLLRRRQTIHEFHKMRRNS
jgi:hypothetical protein